MMDETRIIKGKRKEAVRMRQNMIRDYDMTNINKTSFVTDSLLSGFSGP